MSLLNTLWMDSNSFLHFSFLPTRTNCHSEILMTGTVLSTVGIMNGKIGIYFYRVYILYIYRSTLWINSASLGIFKPGPGKQGLFKHFWWKNKQTNIFMFNPRGWKRRKQREDQGPLPPATPLNLGHGEREWGEGHWWRVQPFPWIAPSAGHLFQWSRCLLLRLPKCQAQGMAWPTVDPTAIAFVYY